VDLDVVEDEPPAVQVDHDGIAGADGAVEPHRHAVGVQVAHVGDVLARLTGRRGSGLSPRRVDVVAVGPDGDLTGDQLEGTPRLGKEHAAN
jgi:hypothetical protein